MLKNNYTFSVAPMMGVTTPSARFMYRLISKKAVLFTEMIASQAIYRGDYNKFLKKNSIEEPVILQVGGSDNELLKFSTNLANKYGYQGVNLNVGCPSKKVSQGRMGACLMKEADIVRDCIKTMISESSSEVSVKCRIGVDEFESYDFFKEFISNVSSSGCKTFFVHARKAFLKGLDPKKNRTLPPLKYDYVYRLKREMPQLNIIINGGIQTLEECHNQLKSVDGVMVGRSIQANPFFLEEVDHQFYNQKMSSLEKNQVIAKYFEYVKETIDTVSTYELLSPLLALCFGIPGSKKFKQEVNDLIRNKDLEKLENTYLSLIAA